MCEYVFREFSDIIRVGLVHENELPAEGVLEKQNLDKQLGFLEGGIQSILVKEDNADLSELTLSLLDKYGQFEDVEALIGEALHELDFFFDLRLISKFFLKEVSELGYLALVPLVKAVRFFEYFI